MGKARGSAEGTTVWVVAASLLVAGFFSLGAALPGGAAWGSPGSPEGEVSGSPEGEVSAAAPTEADGYTAARRAPRPPDVTPPPVNIAEPLPEVAPIVDERPPAPPVPAGPPPVPAAPPPAPAAPAPPADAPSAPPRGELVEEGIEAPRFPAGAPAEAPSGLPVTGPETRLLALAAGLLLLLGGVALGAAAGPPRALRRVRFVGG